MIQVSFLAIVLFVNFQITDFIGKDCDYAKSTCGTPARVQKCIAFGPGDDMFESTDIIAKRQLVAAKAAYNRFVCLIFYHDMMVLLHKLFVQLFVDF